jgi:predicted HTH transcriptional regulator
MQKETQHIAFKPNFNEDVIETLIAFANAKGGKVLIGVDNKGTPSRNFTIGQESLQNWVNQVKNKTQPQIVPDVYIQTIDNKDIVVFEVQEYPIKPVATRGRYYKRIANSNHLLSLDEISNEHLKTINYSWDYYADINYTLNDLLSGKYTSKSRNKLIAKAFKKMEMIERYGTGITRIQNICRNYGVIEPLFQEISDGFQVTLYKEN